MTTEITYSQYKKRKNLRNWLILLLLVPAVYFSALSAKVDFSILQRDNFRMLAMLSEFLYPKWEVLPTILEAAIDTILVAVLGTILGAIISFFFAIYAANNLSGRFANIISRLLIALERSISEILIILLLIVIFGLGLFPGVLAVTISCIGMLGKLYADAIEEIPAKTLESIRSTGASKAQLILFGVLPSIAPALISNTILRFEMNVRASVMLGAIGAGGLGYELQKSYRYADYSEMSVAILTILVLVFASERLSAWLRNRLIRNDKLV